MALIVLGAAKGAPGVTTTTAALAAVWPTPALLVEADPSGSDLQLLARGDNGRHLQGGQRGAGVLGLASHGGNRSTLLKEPITQSCDLGVPVIIGPPHPRAAQAMGPAWNQVGNALAQLSREGEFDVLVDIGRLDDESVALPLISRADVVVLVTRRNLRGIAHTRRVAAIVEEQLRLNSAAAAGATPRLLIVDDLDTPKRVETQWPLAARGLTHSWSMLPPITWDAAGARDLFDATAAQRDTSAFLTSVRTIATELHDIARHFAAPAGGDAALGAAPELPSQSVAPSPQAVTSSTTSSGSSTPAAAAEALGTTKDLGGHPASPDTAGLSPLQVGAVGPPVPAGVVWPPLPPSRRGTAAGSHASDFGTDLDASLEERDPAKTGENPDSASATEEDPDSASATGPSTDPSTDPSTARDEETAPDPVTVTHPHRDPQLTSSGAGQR
ncbi:hypothetical protein [Kineococcus radiotolerans]|uniref:Uncharacterized protein n=1 Tax=Kineococcus radiotolerans (strain ATCC BAA-149 / DSM 14245 / SRS30216) TaxID=266940 RepID=A6WH13_KINRD|nr:hypothetical protein [Kineococcus radiotolerans]ABS06102.1 hypothetical protein Krad_4643 [Kineococcus radiotolerans SRS30216 = ATCC BAA-149]